MERVATPKLSFPEVKFNLEGFYMTVQLMNQLIHTLQLQFQLIQVDC
jgi:hypothetical protein